MYLTEKFKVDIWLKLSSQNLIGVFSFFRSLQVIKSNYYKHMLVITKYIFINKDFY